MATAWGQITGTLAAQADLQAALDAKGTSDFSGAYDDLTGKPTLGTAAATASTDYASAAQGAKADTALQNPAAFDAAGTADAAITTHVGQADPHSQYQRETEKAQANGYASLGADGKVPAAQLPAAGSDPWTYIVLAADVTCSTSAANAGNLGFTPLANTKYEFEAKVMLRTATATVNPRLGLAWPTGLTDGVAQISESQAATGTPLFASGNPNAALLVAVGGLPNTTQSWPALVQGIAIAGASPSGNVRLQIQTETLGTNVFVKAGSFLKYRTYS